MKRFTGFLLVFIVVMLPPLGADDGPPLVQTSHTGRVETLAYSEEASLLFSGGADGTVRGWSPEKGELVARMQISHLPVKMISPHPVLPRLACLETDGINTFIISIWDYEENRRLSIHRITEMPLFISYSPGGSYLVYGKTSWDSLVFLEGNTGRRISVLDEGFGIVSSVFFSRSEKTLLTYSPSGSVQYWDLETKGRKTRFSTEKDLQHTVFSSNGRVMIGEKDGKIYLVDLLSGKVLSSLQEAEGTAIAFDTRRDNLYMVTGDDTEAVCSLYDISGGTLSLISAASFLFSEERSVVTAGNGRLYLGTGEGSIYALEAGNRELKVIGRNNLAEILGITVGNGFLALSGYNRTFLIPLTAIGEFEKGNPKLVPVVFENPFSAGAGIESGPDGRFFLWQTEKAGNLHLLDPESGFTGNIEASGAPIQYFSIDEKGRAVILDKNNTIKVIDTVDGSERFSYQSFGLRAVVPVGPGMLMAGRNKTSSLSAPLLRINTNTGETVPISGTNIVTLDLVYDESRRVLYSLGIEERAGSLKTVLKAHSGPSWERSRTLLAFSGEDHSASFALSRDDSTVFTSLGYGHVRMYKWGGFTSLRRAGRIPEKLEAACGYLFALNTDDTVTVWNYGTGRITAELYFFRDGSSAALGPDGTVALSAEAGRYIEYSPVRSSVY